MKNEILTLDNNDPKVIAARKAEKALFDFYTIEPKEQYITLPENGYKIRVLEFGMGEPLVIVPGNTGDAFPLASLIAEFKGRRIIAINRPGGGLSEGMDHNTVNIREFAHQTLNTIFEALNLKNVDVVAHSMGAHWSTLLALEHPDKVKRLVLLGNPGNIMGGKPPLAMRLIAIPALTKLAMKLMRPKKVEAALNMLKIMGHSKDFIATLPQQLAVAYFAFQNLPHYGISSISLIQNMIPEIKAEELSKLQQPTALILGTNDNFASQETGKKIVDAMPNGTFYPVQNSGHLPWLENPEKCGKLILHFLNGN
ncbi:2-hydroxy-6-oxonona-2,4-dienedioate hydrolase [Pedobacter sp. UYP30]|uniref:alpha/beta fold hydrolase n=1 Tax=Pedobacter sp. UYP30 TaxID=1756400 RepID=UPI0033990871